MVKKNVKKAIFAGGCFWCMQGPFEKVEGVVSVVAGYTGGTTKNPTYREVSSGKTGHLEAVQVTYDPDVVSYETLLDVFWRQIDPTDDTGQFADQGSQYRTAIFWHDDDQKRMAEASKKALDDSGKFAAPIQTIILPATPFYPAEEYHQNYATKNPQEYGRYRKYSGRVAFIERNWEAYEADETDEAGKVDNTGGPVIVYSTPRCQNCNEIKEFLRERGVSFREVDISADERVRDLLIEKTGHIGAPVVQIGDEFIFGLDPKKMEQLLQKERRQEQVIVQTHNP